MCQSFQPWLNGGADKDYIFAEAMGKVGIDSNQI